MTIIKLACYKGKNTLYDYLATTILGYSHIEIVVNGLSYSSSLRDGGVRCKQIKFKTKNWDLFYLGEAKYNIKFEEFYLKTAGAKYDKLSLFLNLLGIKKDTQTNKFTCYEYVARCFNILFNKDININLLPKKLQETICKLN